MPGDLSTAPTELSAEPPAADDDDDDDVVVAAAAVPAAAEDDDDPLILLVISRVSCRGKGRDRPGFILIHLDMSMHKRRER